MKEKQIEHKGNNFVVSDQEVINVLKKFNDRDCYSVAEVAMLLGYSPTYTYMRLKLLEDMGYISRVRGYKILRDVE